MSEIKVTATVSTRNRYHTTLPLCLAAIAQQTFYPDNLIIFDDNDNPPDLREDPLYKNIFQLLDIKKIKWQVIYGQRKGQIFNHQAALTLAKDDWIWRLDDDNLPEVDVLKTLVSNIDDKVGAVGGLVLTPGPLQTLPGFVSDRVEDVFFAPNRQWFLFKNKVEVEHLNSTFLYRKEAGSHGYCMDISKIGHREETIFTHEMKRKGWKLLVDPNAITWHLCSPTKVSTERDQAEYVLWKNDEDVFRRKLREWGLRIGFAVLNNGLGDHFMFKNVLQEFRAKFPNRKFVIGVCFPEVFQDDKDVVLMSIEDAKFQCSKMCIDIDDFDIYKWCIERNWQGSLLNAFREMYLNENTYHISVV